MRFVIYGVAAFVVGALLVGCSNKKDEQAAYAAGCEAGITELVKEQGLTPNPEPIKAYCEKAAKEASEQS